jgi:hypothetical protein
MSKDNGLPKEVYVTLIGLAIALIGSVLSIWNGLFWILWGVGLAMLLVTLSYSLLKIYTLVEEVNNE